MKKNGGQTRSIIFFAAVLLINGAINAALYYTHVLIPYNFIFVNLFVFIAWTYNLKYRFTNRRFRFNVISLGVMMILLCTLCAVKYSFLPDSRLVWYFYYVPLLLMPLFAFLAVLYVGREDDAEISSKWKYLFIPQLVLIVAVITNDFHRLVFTLKPSVSEYSGDYSYNVLYYVIAADIGVYLLLMTARVLYVCARKRFIKKIYLPLLVIAAAAVYFTFFVKVPSDKNFLRLAFEMPVAICILSMAYFESIVYANLIPSNSMHNEFFKSSSLKAGLVDSDYNIVLSAADVGVTDEDIKKSAASPFGFYKGDYILKSSPVKGGYFYWLEDVSELNRINAELKETENYLHDENAIIEASTKIEEQKQRAEQKNRLYDEIARKTKAQLDSVNAVISRAAEKEGGDFRREMELAGIYGVYIKRFSNLYLIATENETADTGELKLSVEESLNYAAMADIETHCEIPAGISVDSAAALYIYELFEAALEAALPSVKSVCAALECENEALTFTMELVEPAAPLTARNGVTVDYADGRELITFKKGVGRSADE